MRLQCAGVLARALRGAWRPYMKGLVDPMIMTGLTDSLVRALRVRLPPCNSSQAYGGTHMRGGTITVKTIHEGGHNREEKQCASPTAMLRVTHLFVLPEINISIAFKQPGWNPFGRVLRPGVQGQPRWNTCIRVGTIAMYA